MLNSSSFILEGGNGEPDEALKLAAGLFCTRNEPVACLVCSSCSKVLKQQHPDVIILDKQGEITADMARQLRSSAFIRPFEKDYKVYIIAYAQNLNTHAQNALLKILEEPPHYCKFLLAVNKCEELLPTVRSRCYLIRSRDLPEPLSHAAGLWACAVLSALDSDDELALAQACLTKCTRDELIMNLRTLSLEMLTLLKKNTQKTGAAFAAIDIIRDILGGMEYNTGVDAVCGLLSVKLWEAFH